MDIKTILNSTGGHSSVPSNTRVLQKALEIFPRIYPDRPEWQPSRSWVVSFKKRHGIMKMRESNAAFER